MYFSNMNNYYLRNKPNFNKPGPRPNFNPQHGPDHNYPHHDYPNHGWNNNPVFIKTSSGLPFVAGVATGALLTPSGGAPYPPMPYPPTQYPPYPPYQPTPYPPYPPYPPMPYPPYPPTPYQTGPQNQPFQQ